MLCARQCQIARLSDEMNTVCNAIPDCQMIDEFPRVPEGKLSKGDRRDTQGRKGWSRGKRRGKGKRTRWEMHGS